MFRKILMTFSILMIAQLVFISTLSAQGAEKSREEIEAEVSKMSSKERLESSSDRIKDMRAKLEEVKNLLDETRDKERDIRKLNCIADKAMSMKGYVKVSEQSYTSLKEAEGKQPPDTDAVVHHYILIAVAYGRTLELNQDAKLCVGQTDEISEEGELTLSKDPNIVPLDPIFPGGYLGVEDLFGDILDPSRVPALTPLQ